MNPLALFFAASVIWGSTWIAITYQLGDVPPEASVAYRFALAAVLLLAWCAVSGVRLRYGARDHLAMAVQGALLFGANYVLVYHSERYLASGLVAVVFSLMVFCNIIGMRLFFAHAIAPRMIVGALLGVTGVALLFWPELARFQGGAQGAVGLGIALSATVVASLGNLIALRNHRAGIPVRASTGYGMLYGAALVSVWAVMHGVEWRFNATPAYVISLVYLAVFGSVIAFVSYLTLVGKIGADRAGYVGVVVPGVALLLSSLLEGYRWTTPALIGVALCVGGNVSVLATSRRALKIVTPVAPESSRAGP